MPRCTPRPRGTEIYRVDITPLKRQPGTQRPFAGHLAPPDGTELTTAEVAATELHFDLQLEVAGSELIAQGCIGLAWAGPCRRCLEPTSATAMVELREIFSRSPVEGETYPLEEDFVDLAPMVREAVMLALPVAPLCGDDCAGPDPSRFPAAVEADDPTASAEDSERAIDPRWAALSELNFDDE